MYALINNVGTKNGARNYDEYFSCSDVLPVVILFEKALFISF